MKKKKKQSKNRKVSLGFFNSLLIFLFIALLPTQLGKHFFLPFSFISGIRIDYLAPTLYLTDILVVILAVGNWRFFLESIKNRFVLPVVFILLIHSVVFAQFPQLAFYKLLKLVEIVFVFFLFKKHRLSQGLVLWGLLAGVVLEVILAVSQFTLKHSVQGLFYFFGERTLTLSLSDIAKASLQGVELLRPYGTFSHPNSLAGFYLLVYAYVLSLKNNKHQWLARTILLGSTILIFLSFSKIAIGIFLLINFVYLLKRGDLSCKLCIVSRMLVFAALAFVFMSAQTDPFSITKRLELFQNAFQVIKKYPWGTGLGHYVIAQAQMGSRFILLTFQPVHNVALYLLSEIGIVLFALLLFFGGKHILRKFGSLSFALCAIVVLGTGMADHYWITLQQNLLLLPVVFARLDSE